MGPSLLSSHHLFGDGFFFSLVCLNDVRAIPLVNKVVNTTRCSSEPCTEAKNMSKNNSLRVWVLFVWSLKKKIPKRWKQ